MKDHVATTLPVGISHWLPVGGALGSSLGVVFGMALNKRSLVWELDAK